MTTLDRARCARYRIATIPGDGVGPEVVAAARRVVDAAGARFGFAVDWSEHVVGGAAIDAVRRRDPGRGRRGLRRGRRDPARRGRRAEVGRTRGAAVRPEQALFALRGGARAVRQPAPGDGPADAGRLASPLTPELLAGVDMLIVRELTGGLYFGDRTEADRASPARGPRSTRCRMRSTRSRASCASRSSWPHAARRGSPASTRPTCWPRRACGGPVADEIAVRVPGRPADPPARRLVRDAADPAAGRLRRHRDREPVRRHPVGRGGGAGRVAGHAARRRRSASARTEHGTFGLYEPIHGSAPDIAGQDIGQPDRHDPVGRDAAADSRSGGPTRPRRSRRPSAATLDDGWRTADLADRGRRRTDGLVVVGTTAFATAVVEALEAGAAGGRVTAPRRPTPRSSSTTRPCATARRARTSRCRWPTSCASRGCSTSSGCRSSRAAGRARTPRTSSSSRPPGRCAGSGRKLAAFGIDPPPLEHARRRPEPARAGRRRDAGRDDLRQELAAPRHRGARRHAGREPRHDRRLGRVRRRSRPRGGLRRRALLRRLQGGSRLCARRRCGPPARPARGRSSCATRTAGR